MDAENKAEKEYYEFALYYGEGRPVLTNSYGDVYIWKTSPICFPYYFMKSLNSDKSMNFIHTYKFTGQYRTGSSRIITVRNVTFKKFTVNIKSKNTKSRKIPLIVEKCEEGFKDAIFGIKFETKKYIKRIKTFEMFTEQTGTVSASYLAELIKSMNDEELEDYFIKVTKFAQYVNNYGLKLIEEADERKKAEEDKKVQKLIEEQEYKQKEQMNVTFIENFQRSRGLAIKEKHQN